MPTLEERPQCMNKPEETANKSRDTYECRTKAPRTESPIDKSPRGHKPTGVGQKPTFSVENT